MKAITKTLGIMAFALMIPLTAGAATAAQAPESTAFNTALTSTAKTGNIGLVQKTVKPEAIKVAGRRGRGLALGIFAGVATAAILAGASRRSHAYNNGYSNHSYRRRANYSYRRHQRRCDRWAYRCDCGIERACRKYYRNCD